MVQLWVNLPARDKMSPPKYQAIKNENINLYKLENEAGVIEIIAGTYKGLKGAASTFTPHTLIQYKIKKRC
jgi:redox-sensitive bicupin YhaK (pirin superfamily)